MSQVKNGQTTAPVWPDAAKANPLIPGSQYPTLDALRNVVPGISKLEVYRLIGHPQFHEGMAGVHEWDYVFHLPTGNGNEFVTCQFKQLFDDNMRAAEHFWKPESCAQLVNAVPAPAPPPPAAKPHVSSEIEISADFLFDFDSDRLSANAPAAIQGKVVEALEKASNVEVLKVIGYTDRLGSDDYNLKLSMRRAMAVKNYLISQGIPAEAISAEGRGSTDPKVQCNQKDRAALIACLKPNRRVLIQVVAR
ncbi:OmpA family protein [Dyella telluris]|uniref:OmpA family protein n=1 Tax=Dyella telluris TaxID=2763498 RepID=A0A7G8Q0V5_9GAMM|nr:OmpA family protein [Dyella telluris]QNK00413.1 OmpA family protein [Dyella telluris]